MRERAAALLGSDWLRPERRCAGSRPLRSSGSRLLSRLQLKGRRLTRVLPSQVNWNVSPLHVHVLEDGVDIDGKCYFI